MLQVCTAGRRFMYDGKEERGRMSTILAVPRGEAVN
jgi:hypothetical protein